MPNVEPLREGDPAAVGPYRLVGRLGAGGHGVAYLGQARNGTPVAVKVLREGLAESDRLAASFDAARRVEPFCLAPVLDASTSGRAYIVFAYVDGPSLQETGPVGGTELTRLAVATATALDALHQAGVLHLDLRPANVLLAPDGARVVDYGIAGAFTAGVSAMGNLAGTPAYLAPEQLTGQEAGAPADVFAWAGVITFAATGAPPFGTAPLPAVINRIRHEPPGIAGVPGPLRDIVAACLSKDPAARPAMRDVLLGLFRTERPQPLASPPHLAPDDYTTPPAPTRSRAAGEPPPRGPARAPYHDTPETDHHRDAAPGRQHGAEPSPRYGAEAGRQHGAEPSPRYGAEAGRQHGAEPRRPPLPRRTSTRFPMPEEPLTPAAHAAPPASSSPRSDAAAPPERQSRAPAAPTASAGHPGSGGHPGAGGHTGSGGHVACGGPAFTASPGHGEGPGEERRSAFVDILVAGEPGTGGKAPTRRSGRRRVKTVLIAGISGVSVLALAAAIMWLTPTTPTPKAENVATTDAASTPATTRSPQRTRTGTARPTPQFDGTPEPVPTTTATTGTTPAAATGSLRLVTFRLDGTRNGDCWAGPQVTPRAVVARTGGPLTLRYTWLVNGSVVGRHTAAVPENGRRYLASPPRLTGTGSTHRVTLRITSPVSIERSVDITLCAGV
ncbi:MAG TPA: serine/threonine-protein kinase [Nonomuraea sp.]|nr:serine/threonine-protein kinase [Nonomuraea sp.]